MGNALKMIFADAVTDVYTAAETADGAQKAYVRDWLGHVRYDDQGNIYRFVQNDTTSAQVAGQVVCHQIANLGTSMVQKVKTPATADLYLFAGVCISALPTTGGKGWIQIKGYNADCDVDEPGTTAIVLGGSLKVANTLSYGMFDTNATTAATTPTYIQALEAVSTTTPATASTTNIKVYIHGMV